MKRIISFSLAFTFFVAVGYFGMAITHSQGKSDQAPGGSHELNVGAPSQNRGFALTVGGTAATSPITNHGGPVMTGTIHVYLIWYGNWNQTNGTDTPAGQQLVRDFVSNIGGSPHFNINTSYPGITGAVTYSGQTTDTGTKTRLTDSNIQSIVSSAITSGRLPKDSSGVYFVLTSSNVTASSGFCTQYCGWHTYATISGSNIKYSFVGNAARCINSCAAQTTSPNGNAGVDGMISVITHELEEAASDPNLNAWYDASGAENADKCAWTFGHFQYQVANGSWANVHLGTRDYLIQRNLLHGTSDFCMVDATHN